MSSSSKKLDALRYHEQGKPGKIEVVPTKSMTTQRDLALAYSPGVAEPCLEIANNKEDVYRYTAKGNLVGVISNGTAVLGLGDIGPDASKPVMEGKGVLFKKFAGIDVFDIEVDEKDPDKFIEIVKALEPTFGGVNLEDIKAPESFKIETELREKMGIPVMHDDQHGTAIISAAALINALELIGKKIEEVTFVVNGAGAAAVSCTKLYMSLGAKKENIVMVDSKGCIRVDRENLTPSKAEFATDRDVNTLDEAVFNADVFIGLSMGNVLSAEALKTMANNPIVFALANPVPEIDYDLAMATRDDIVMATGRSDHPNQVNNVLGFPFIFRGALDVRATTINEEMKLATVKALAELAKEQVPDLVNKAYGANNLKFGKNYLIPKPLDPRLITKISPAVAKAAIDSGVAKVKIEDWLEYEYDLQRRVGIDQKLVLQIIERAKNNPKKVVFAEGDNVQILRAANILKEEGICEPILLGDKAKIGYLIEKNNLELSDCQILDPVHERETRVKYGNILHEKRKRKGVSQRGGRKLMRDRNFFASMMVEHGEADALISGQTKDYASTVKPILQVIGKRSDINKVAGIYMLLSESGVYFFSDTTLNINPTAEELADITRLTAEAVRFFDLEPRIAMLSYSNFGSSNTEGPNKVARATKILHEQNPELIVEGEMQANIALNPELQKELYPFSKLGEKGANTLIFPTLESSNIAYKLIQSVSNVETIGPILVGAAKPVHILQMGSSVRDIVNMAAIAVVDAQEQVNN